MTFIRKNYILILLLIPVLSFIMHLHVFKLDLVGIHVWRQTQTQTVINNFYREDFNILNSRVNEYTYPDRIKRMEFPVMQWIFAVFHKMFGPDIAISRFLTFIIGFFSILGMFRLADTIFKDKGAATLCAWTFNWSPVFYYYTVNPLPDNFALCCGIWSAAFFFKYIRANKFSYIIASALFIGLATLAKLPFILYGSVAFGYIIIRIRKGAYRQSALIAITFLLAVLPAICWYAWVIPTWEGNGVTKGVFDLKENLGQLAEIMIGNLTSVLPELLLNYGSVLFFIAGVYFIFKNRVHKKQYFSLFVLWCISIVAYFLFEANMIALVHDYYLFPFLPMLFLLVALGAWKLLHSKTKFLRYLSLLLLIILPVTAYLRIDSRWNATDPGFNAVYFHDKDELRKLVPKDAKVVTGNDNSHFITLYYLDRKGWSFDNNWLDAGYLEQYINKGAGYLFTDSDVDKNEGIIPHLGEKIFEKGTLRVYKLK